MVKFQEEALYGIPSGIPEYINFEKFHDETRIPEDVEMHEENTGVFPGRIFEGISLEIPGKFFQDYDGISGTLWNLG